MIRNLIILPDGTEIFSGDPKATASIQSVRFTESVNAGEELTIGSACCCMLEATLLTPGGGSTVAEGTEVMYYRVADDGTRTKMGPFTLEKPERKSANAFALTAYDRMSWTDIDLSPWLRDNQDMFPISVYDFAVAVCAQCGLTLVNTSLRNGDWQINAFYADGLTGRQLLQWVGQACAQFCRITPDGELEYAWFADKRSTFAVASYDSNNVSWLMAHDDALLLDRNGALLVLQDDHVLAWPFYQGALTFAEYQPAAIEKVQIRYDTDDVGVVWPDETGEKNTYSIEGNMLLLTDSEASLQPVARAVYEALQQVSYTPFEACVPAQTYARAGDRITIKNANGVVFDSYIFSRTINGQRETLSSTGSARRNSSTVVNSQQYKNLSGKVLRLKTSVDGLKVQAEDLQGKQATLELTVDGLSARVSELTEENLLADPTFSTYTDTNTISFFNGGFTAEANDDYWVVRNSVPADKLADCRGKTLNAYINLWQEPGAVWADGSAMVSVQLKFEYTDGSTGMWTEMFASRTTHHDEAPSLPIYATTYTVQAQVPDKELKTIYIYIDAQGYRGTLHTNGWMICYQTSGERYSELIQRVDAIEQRVVEVNNLSETRYSELSQTVNSLTLTVDNGEVSSVIRLKCGDIELASQQIKLTGMVTFEDLQSEGSTIINGSNITTGSISADRISAGTVYISEDGGENYITLDLQYTSPRIQMGTGLPGGSGRMWTTYQPSGYSVDVTGKNVIEITAVDVTEGGGDYAGQIRIAGPSNYYGVKLSTGTAGGGLVDLFNSDGARTISLEGGNGGIVCGYISCGGVYINGAIKSWYKHTFQDANGTTISLYAPAD